MTIACCVCNQIRIDGEWVNPRGGNPNEMSHMYCPPCMAIQLNEIRRERHDETGTPARVAHAM